MDAGFEQGGMGLELFEDPTLILWINVSKQNYFKRGAAGHTRSPRPSYLNPTIHVKKRNTVRSWGSNEVKKHEVP